MPSRSRRRSRIPAKGPRRCWQSRRLRRAQARMASSASYTTLTGRCAGVSVTLCSRMDRFLIALAAAFLFAGTASAAPSARTFVIHGDAKVGSFAIKANGTLAGAIDAFGEPSSLRRRYREQGCLATWRRLGLRIDFYNLAGRDACEPSSGRFGRAIARGRHWQTTKRLKVGDSVRKLRRLYSGASSTAASAGFGLRASGLCAATRSTEKAATTPDFSPRREPGPSSPSTSATRPAAIS
jgi:hypothetical protein